MARLADLGLTLGDIDLGGIDAESDHKLADYFVTTPYVESALAGKRTLFLGRKGSGKSALFSQLERLLQQRQSTDNTGLPAAAVLSATPDQYAWAALREYREQGILSEQAHTNAWKLTLAIEIAAKLVSLQRDWLPGPEDAVSRLRAFLAANFGTVQPGFTKTATSIVKGLRHFNFSAFGFGLGFDKDTAELQPMTPTVVASLFDVIGAVLQEQQVLVAFDRLDDSWDGSADAHSLIVGLLKAAKELNDRFRAAEPGGLRVLVFLRSDIYDSVRFDDKDKHRPTEEHIAWQPDELKEMLQRRLPNSVSVDELFEPGDMRGSPPFSYITKRTFLRPREILQFMEECIRQASSHATEISKDQVRAAEERYSRWKVDDLKQEYAKAAPMVEPLLDCLRQGVHRYDSLRDLELVLETRAPELVKDRGLRALLELLFDSSIIGVRLGNSGSARFKSEDSELVLPSSGAVYVHQSLYKGLNIRETRKPAETDDAEAGSVQDRVTIDLYGAMLSALPIQDLTFLNVKPTPVDVFRHESFAECAKALGIDLLIDSDGTKTTSIARPSTIANVRFLGDTKQYESLRTQMMQILGSFDMTPADYEAGERAARRQQG